MEWALDLARLYGDLHRRVNSILKCSRSCTADTSTSTLANCITLYSSHATFCARLSVWLIVGLIHDGHLGPPDIERFQSATLIKSDNLSQKIRVSESSPSH
jgi:hypothetical protein